MESNPKKKMNYRAAGVSIDRGNQLVERIKSVAQKTFGKGVGSNLGSFGALFDISALQFKDPILVSGTDGVGTKVKLAIDLNRHDTIGIDLVAMCANDLLAQGAAPLFFLDYFACSRLDVETASTVITGIANGCIQAGCSLIGGETAEMPDMYVENDYDLAGFCVGAVERDKIIDGSKIKNNDVLIAIASSGPHSNGYSLIRKILESTGTKYDQEFQDKTIGEILLEPTKIYVKSVLDLISRLPVHGIAHITGGGIIENVPRILPAGFNAVVNTKSWHWQPVFQWLKEMGNIDSYEMYRTFNCGVGMILSLAPEQKDAAIQQLQKAGETAWIIGYVSENKSEKPAVIFSDL